MTYAFPRYFRIAGAWINSYQVLLCVGIYVGSLTTAAYAEHAGRSPLAVGMASALCALAGLVGARVYHLALNLSHYRQRGWGSIWERERGGWSVLGALLTFVPATFVAAPLLGVAKVELWDLMAAGVMAGGFWIRLGCVFNGCCTGRVTRAWYGVRLHDTAGVRAKRLPVQFLEMAWWLAGSLVFAWAWTLRLAPGSYALGLLAGYGLVRVVLEPMREHHDLLFGRVRANQLAGLLMALAAGGALVAAGWR